MMQTYLVIILCLAAFGLGSCPFAFWIGKYLMKKDIRKYGDSNPGTFNVFRAGSVKYGLLSLFLEIGKGYPFVAAAHHYFDLNIVFVCIIAICAILGHAFSPLLRFHGGKALAVTGGTILALPTFEIFIALILLLALFYLFVNQDSWVVILSFIGGIIYFLLTKGLSWEPALITCITIILVFKHLKDLKAPPGFSFKPVRWLHIKRAV